MELIKAAASNNIDEVKRLLDSGANPNSSIDSAKLTPLHFAAQKNGLEIAMLLLEAGADPFAYTEPDGETALDVAQLYNHQQMISLLMHYMQDVEVL
jgi:ankyrin repeat protein